MPRTRSLHLLDSAVALTRARERVALRAGLVHTLQETLPLGDIRIVNQESLARLQTEQDDALQWHFLPLPDDDGKGEGEQLAICLPPEVDADAEMRIIRGFVTLYRNFLEVIDDSERDRLTKLLNRRAFDAHLERMSTQLLTQRGRENTLKRAWLGLLDIDFFKRINDRFGHLYGDEVLILVARVLRQEFGGTDRVFRYGGEEFAVLLEACSREAAQALMEACRKSMSVQSFPGVGHVTMSIGFCAMESGLAPSVIIERADRALYFAKNNGRDQVVDYADLLGDQTLGTTVAGEIELF